MLSILLEVDEKEACHQSIVDGGWVIKPGMYMEKRSQVQKKGAT